MLEPLSFLPKTKHRPTKEPLGDGTGWLVTLTDLSLLLLCSFLVWHVIDKQEITSPTVPQVTTAALAPSVFLPYVLPSSVDPIVVPHVSPRTEEVPSTGDGGEQFPAFVEQWGALKAEMETYATESGLGASIDVVSTQHELLLALKDTVLFASGEAGLRDSILPVLDKVASLARNHPDLAVEVLGHTDDIPIATPEFPSNWELSAARASRVARRLIDAGVVPTRVSAQGYASFRPLRPNTSEENRATNRRVEIRFYRGIDKGTMANKARRHQETLSPARADHITLPE